MNQIEKCTEHSGVCERIANMEKSVDKIWKRIDIMTNSVMIGMGALIIQAIIFILSLVKHP